MYGFSVLHCLPATMAENPVVATGTVMRQPIMHRYATEAGFTRVEELDVETRSGASTGWSPEQRSR
jgi:hypothetical protein